MPDIRLESLRCVYSAGTPFEKVALDNIDLSIPAGQYAALEALTSGAANHYADVMHMVRAYDRRRRLVVDAFRKMGLDCFEPNGAFYAFPSIQKTGMTSQEFCKRLLTSQQVAAVPGDAFGPLGEGHIRISYAASTEKLTEAMKRIDAFLQGI